MSQLINDNTTAGKATRLIEQRWVARPQEEALRRGRLKDRRVVRKLRYVQENGPGRLFQMKLRSHSKRPGTGAPSRSTPAEERAEARNQS